MHSRDRGARPVLAAALAAFLIVWEPLSFAATAASSLNRLILYGVPAFGLLAVRALVVAWGVATGLALWRCESHAPGMARWWLLARAGGLVLTFLTPYFPSNQLARFKLPTLAAWLAAHAACWAWLRWSRRLRAACSPDPPAK